MRLVTMGILILCFHLSWSKSIHVYPGETSESIIDAYTRCMDGDTLVIHSGEYHLADWVITKQITILGDGRPDIISSNGNGIITIERNSVTVAGLRLSGVKTNYLKEEAGIRVRNCSFFKLLNNHIEDCFFSIYLERTNHGDVKRNLIEGNATTEAGSGNGIHAWYCNDITIEHNDIANHRDGIYLEFVDSSLVADNHSHHNTRYGLHYMFSNDDTYLGNLIEKNGVGVAVMFSRRITMRDNTFSHNWGNAAYGLLLKEIYDAHITNNEFIRNTVGIFVEGSNRINYSGNIFSRNGWGIKFSGGCETNIISNNAFLNNSMDLVVSSQVNDNIFDGNYWSGYAGYDLNRDGIGDVVHYPVKLYSYVLDQVPEAVVLMRSLFIDLLNFSEKVSPTLTPRDVIDHYPKMNM